MNPPVRVPLSSGVIARHDPTGPPEGGTLAGPGFRLAMNQSPSAVVSLAPSDGERAGVRGPSCSHSSFGPMTLSPSAFTLVEMLVVLGIIGMVLAIALPNMRSHEGRDLDAGVRQLLSDLSLARARAINGRSTVLVAFIPPEINSLSPTGANGDQIKQLQAGIYTQYALYTPRRTGDQPGQFNARYLTEWRSLPKKVFIATNAFAGMDSSSFPFPTEGTNAPTLTMPCVAFNYEGRPCLANGDVPQVPYDVHIPLARGSIMYSRDAAGNVLGFSVQEVPPGNSLTASNHIVIDQMTGRARLVRQEVQ